MVLVNRQDYLDTYKSEYHGRKVFQKHKRWFPVSKSTELAALIGDLTTDGHVQPEPKLRFDFTSSSKRKLRSFEDRLDSLFGVKGKIRENTTNPYSVSYNYGVNSKPLTRILILCGVPTGNKVKTEFNIPEWIREDKEYFNAYVERAFANDGSAFADNPRITFELRKERSKAENLERYMKTINRFLEKYHEISGSIFRRSEENRRKDGDVTVGIGLNIRRRNAIKNFHEAFNITDPHMSKEIEKVAGM